MFSRAEIEFLKDSRQVSDNYERSLTHHILTKLKDFEEVLPLLESNPKTRAWLHGVVAKNSSVAGFSSIAYIQNEPKSSPISGNGWFSGRDSDPGRELERLICDCHRQVSKTLDLESFAVYGSVSRGKATANSDVDILLIQWRDAYGSKEFRH